jgi:hypothetical protein
LAVNCKVVGSLTALVTLLGGCGDRGRAPAPVSASPLVSVEEDDASRETRYTIKSGECRITWTVFRTEANLGVVRHRADCALGLGEQAPLIAKLLEKAGTFHTLMWGRLYPDGAREATMALRLAVAARRSEDWDVVKGRPKRGDVNAWARKTMEGSRVYEELRPVFGARGLDIRLASVEKVLVQEAGKLTFFDELSAAGVGVADKVPFDCQTWFAVRALGG